MLAQVNKSALRKTGIYILGDLTLFFLIWPYDAIRPLTWRDDMDAWFWLHLALPFSPHRENKNDSEISYVPHLDLFPSTQYSSRVMHFS